MHASAEARYGDRRGFLLLEALIGLAIIGLVAIALLATTSLQVRTADKASVLLVASALAQDRMAAVHLLDYDGLKDPPDSLLAGVFPAPFEEYSWTAQVEPSEGEYDLFAIRVEVKGRGEVFPSETLLHRPQPVLGATGGQGQGGQVGPGGRGGNAGPGGGRGRGGDQPGGGPGGGRGGGGGGGAGRGGRGGQPPGGGRGAVPGGGRGGFGGGGGGGVGGRGGVGGPVPGGRGGPVPPGGGVL